MEFFSANKEILLLILSMFTTVLSIYFLVKMAFKTTIGLLFAFSLYLLFFASPEMKQATIIKWDGIKTSLFSSDFVIKQGERLLSEQATSSVKDRVNDLDKKNNNR